MNRFCKIILISIASVVGLIILVGGIYFYTSFFSIMHPKTYSFDELKGQIPKVVQFVENSKDDLATLVSIQSEHEEEYFSFSKGWIDGWFQIGVSQFQQNEDNGDSNLMYYGTLNKCDSLSKPEKEAINRLFSKISELSINSTGVTILFSGNSGPGPGVFIVNTSASEQPREFAYFEAINDTWNVMIYDRSA